MLYRSASFVSAFTLTDWLEVAVRSRAKANFTRAASGLLASNRISPIATASADMAAVSAIMASSE